MLLSYIFGLYTRSVEDYCYIFFSFGVYIKFEKLCLYEFSVFRIIFYTDQNFAFKKNLFSGKNMTKTQMHFLELWR
jgi:hypothetical protein